MRKSDSGLSEVVSVVMILTVVILTIVLAALVIIPIMGDNEERVHNGDVLLEFASMKADVDTAWISNNTGVTRQAVFTLSCWRQNRGYRDAESLFCAFFRRGESGIRGSCFR